jgi:hypothetical protein
MKRRLAVLVVIVATSLVAAAEPPLHPSAVFDTDSIHYSIATNGILQTLLEKDTRPQFQPGVNRLWLHSAAPAAARFTLITTGEAQANAP